MFRKDLEPRAQLHIDASTVGTASFTKRDRFGEELQQASEHTPLPCDGISAMLYVIAVFVGASSRVDVTGDDFRGNRATRNIEAQRLWSVGGDTSQTVY